MRSKVDQSNQPVAHGAKWNDTEGVVIKSVSRGPGEAIELSNPRRAQPRRVLSSDGVTSDLKQESGKLSVTSNKEAGEPINLVVEY